MKYEITPIGFNNTKLLIDLCEPLQEALELKRTEAPKGYLVPSTEDYHQVTFDPSLKSTIETVIGKEITAVLKLCDYDFVDEKKVRRHGCYIRLMAIIPTACKKH